MNDTDKKVYNYIDRASKVLRAYSSVLDNENPSLFIEIAKMIQIEEHYMALTQR